MQFGLGPFSMQAPLSSGKTYAELYCSSPKRQVLRTEENYGSLAAQDSELRTQD